MGGHGDHHGHGHGHHAPPYVVPDASIYKIENAPELMEVQAKLAEHGLKDPWLRNDVWRFERKHWGTFRSRALGFFLRGWKVGVPLFIATIAIEKAFGIEYGHGHGHGHEHGHGEDGKHH